MKYKHRFHIFVLILSGLLLFSSCDIIDSLKKDKDDEKDDDKVEFVDGISRDILEFVTEQDIAVLQDSLGIPIHRGNNPPHLNTSFKVSPKLLKKTNVENDFAIGYRFSDSHLRLYNQNDDLFTIEVDHAEVNFETGETISMGLGRGSFLVGNGQAFSIFSRNDYELASGEKADLLYLYSGVLTSNGIQNFQYALLMLNNNGHDTVFIKNQTGRSFEDGEGFSEEAPFPSSKSKDILSSGFSNQSGLLPLLQQ